MIALIATVVLVLTGNLTGQDFITVVKWAGTLVDTTAHP